MQVDRHGSNAVTADAEWSYEVVDDFLRLPRNATVKSVAAVAIDKDDNLYVFAREGSAPVTIFDRKGDYVASWGQGQFVHPHGLHIGRDNLLYCTDDLNHVVRKYTLDGKLLLEIGIPGKPAKAYSGEPFNRCTHTALSPENDIYVSDGYANSRVHKYSQEGKLIRSWGSNGLEPGQFNIAHNIGCDDAGWVYVADRENHRVQVFDGKGRFETELRFVHRPCGLTVDLDPNGYCYVGELEPGYEINAEAPDLGPRVTIMTKQGKIVSRTGNSATTTPTKRFFTPHSIALDSQRNIYVADLLTAWEKAYPGVARPPNRGTVKKLVRKTA